MKNQNSSKQFSETTNSIKTSKSPKKFNRHQGSIPDIIVQTINKANLRSSAIDLYKYEKSRPFSVDLHTHGASRAILRKICKDAVLQATKPQSISPRDESNIISPIQTPTKLLLQSSHTTNNPNNINKLRLLQREQLIASRLGELKKVKILEDEIQEIKGQAKKAQEELETKLFSKRLNSLNDEFDLRAEKLEESLKSTVYSFEELCFKDEKNIIARQEQEFSRIIENATRRATGMMTKCNCKTPYICRHNKNASYNSRKPTHEVVEYRRNAARLRSEGNHDEAVFWEQKAKEIDDREQEKWRNQMATNIIVSPWGANEAIVDRLTETHKQEIEELHCAQQIQREKLIQQHVSKEKLLYQTYFSEVRKIRIQCRKIALHSLEKELQEYEEEVHDVSIGNKEDLSVLLPTPSPKSTNIKIPTKPIFQKKKEDSSSLLLCEEIIISTDIDANEKRSIVDQNSKREKDKINTKISCEKSNYHGNTDLSSIEKISEELNSSDSNEKLNNSNNFHESDEFLFLSKSYETFRSTDVIRPFPSIPIDTSQSRKSFIFEDSEPQSCPQTPSINRLISSSEIKSPEWNQFDIMAKPPLIPKPSSVRNSRSNLKEESKDKDRDSNLDIDIGDNLNVLSSDQSISLPSSPMNMNSEANNFKMSIPKSAIQRLIQKYSDLVLKSPKAQLFYKKEYQHLFINIQKQFRCDENSNTQSSESQTEYHIDPSQISNSLLELKKNVRFGDNKIFQYQLLEDNQSNSFKIDEETESLLKSSFQLDGRNEEKMFHLKWSIAFFRIDNLRNLRNSLKCVLLDDDLCSNFLLFLSQHRGAHRIFPFISGVSIQDFFLVMKYSISCVSKDKINFDQDELKRLEAIIIKLTEYFCCDNSMPINDFFKFNNEVINNWYSLLAYNHLPYFTSDPLFAKLLCQLRIVSFQPPQSLLITVDNWILKIKQMLENFPVGFYIQPISTLLSDSSESELNYFWNNKFLEYLKEPCDPLNYFSSQNNSDEVIEKINQNNKDEKCLITEINLQHANDLTSRRFHLGITFIQLLSGIKYKFTLLLEYNSSKYSKQLWIESLISALNCLESSYMLIEAFSADY